MDSVRAKHLEKELLGKCLNGWTVGIFISNGKSAAVFHASNEAGDVGAIKVFDRELVEKQGKECQLERIKREKSLVGQHHPNLIKILDGGYSEDNDYCFVVMEYLPGNTLSDIIPTFPRDKITSVIYQIASAAKYLEELGLAHRDIKPENIRILDDMTAVLLDLGVLRPYKASAITDGDEGNKAFIGTLQYSSPEFLLGEEEDSLEGWRSLSFYQLGAVLHDLIMRRPLFNNLHPYAKIVNAVQRTTPNITASDVAIDVVFLSRKCLIKNWKKRLECVAWSDFQEKPPSIDLDRLRDKISRNKVAAQALAVDQQMECEDSDADLKVRIDQLSESLLKVARKIRSTYKDIFPAVETEITKSCKASCKHVVLCFSPSASFGLNTNLSIFLHLKLIDTREKAVEIRVCGRVSAIKDTAPPCSECEKMERAYIGIYDSNHIEVILTPILLSLFGTAQEAALAKALNGNMAQNPSEYIHFAAR